MTQAERKLFRQTAALGALLILLIIFAKASGLLDPLDQWIYDRRAQYFQHATPPPTDRLVHFDIDDNALATIGGWPWERTEWARIVDELRLAGAKTVGFDVFFSERQKIVYRPQDGGSFTEIDHDRAFADAIARAGNVVLGVPLKFEDDIARVPPDDRPHYLTLIEAMKQNLATSQEDAHALLVGGGVSQEKAGEYVARFFVSARQRALFTLILTELANGEKTADAIQKTLLAPLPRKSQALLRRAFQAQFERADAIDRMQRFGIALPRSLPPLLTPEHELATIPPLSEAAADSGFVDDYLRYEDGTIRSLPLWVRYRGQLFAQFGLVLACRTVDVPLSEVIISDNAVVIPAKGARKKPIRIPVRVRESETYGRIGAVMDVPWFGPPKWEQMYDHERKGMDKQHLSIVAAWTVWDNREKVRTSAASADRAIMVLLGPDGVQPDGTKRKGFNLAERKAAEYAAAPLPPDDVATRLERTQDALRMLRESGWIEQYGQMTEMTEEDRFERDELTAARDTLQEFGALVDQLRASEESLRSQVADKAVLIGWIAEGKVDLVPTPLHAAAPGVTVHGAVFNAILTQDFWRRAPGWVSYAMIVLIGAAATWLASRLPPWQSMAATLLLIVLPGVIDAVLVFDYGNVILDAAGPAVVAPVIWAVLTVVRFIVERAERERITGRFRSYVDPALVDYVLTNPDRARLEGQERELTVVFTDLGGFTTLTERLGKGTVPILNDYMSLMVPIIRRHSGYVNKFLGDGIMFFFGAPRPNPNHATAAVDAVMEMQAAMADFNRSLEARELPTLVMRAGINTGAMIVGDAGPVDGSDYTVLGDAVNLAARLESANKATGTLVMVGERTAELLAGRYTLLPLARLQVKGKSRGVMTFSPLARAGQATPEQKRRSELQHEMVELFQSGRFADCRELIEAIEAEFGETKMASVYRAECLQEKPEFFDGTIVLTEK